jgi:hypothetical protein
MKDNDKQQNDLINLYYHEFDFLHIVLYHDIYLNQMHLILLMDNDHDMISVKYLQAIQLTEKTDHNHVHNHCTLYDEQDVLKKKKDEIFIWNSYFDDVHEAFELRQWKTRKCVNR